MLRQSFEEIGTTGECFLIRTGSMGSNSQCKLLDVRAG
jgi:hypothetical protein